MHNFLLVMMNPTRPDKGGTLGRSIKVHANIFPVSKLAATTAYQYDVTVEPDLPPAKARLAWMQFELVLNKKNGPTCLIYDGQKQAFGVSRLVETKASVYILKDPIVNIPPISANRPSSSGRGGRGRGGGDRGRGRGRGGSQGGSAPAVQPTLSLAWTPPKETPEKSKEGETEKITITIKEVAVVDFHHLMQFMQGKAPETSQSMTGAMVLNILLRHVPSMLFVPVGSNFFTPEGRIPMVGGLEIWRGYHQSALSLMAGHLGINIDLASCVFQKGSISVLDFLLEVFGVQSVEELGKVPRVLVRITEVLKGVVVVTTHRPGIRNRFKVAKIRDTPNKYFFDCDGKKINVTQYFKSTYNINLRYPDLPIAWKQNGKTGFPLECLEIVPAQRVTKKLNPDQTADMIRATTQKPGDRKRSIESAVKNSLKYQNNPYLQSFGMQSIIILFSIK